MSSRSSTVGTPLALVAVLFATGACAPPEPDPHTVTDSSGVIYPLSRTSATANLDLNLADYPDMPLMRRTKPRKAKDPNAVETPAVSFDMKTRKLFRSSVSDPPAVKPTQGLSKDPAQDRTLGLKTRPADSATPRPLRQPGPSSFQGGPTSESDIDALPRGPAVKVDRLPEAMDSLDASRGLMLKRDLEQAGVDPLAENAVEQLKGIAALSVRGDSTAWPGRSSVRMFISWPNGTTSSCSGKLIGLRTVFTAGHCLFLSDRGGFASGVRVVPGLDGTYMPFGDAFVNHMRVAANWVDEEDNDDDWAAAFVDRDLGAVTGHFGVLPASIDSLDSGIHSAAWGYPGNQGTLQLVRATGNTDCADTWMIYHDLPVSAGFSGSGHHPQSGSNQDKLFGVVSSINNFNILCGETDSPASTRINNTRHGFIRDFMDENPPGFQGSLAGWEPLGGLGNTAVTAVSWGPDRNDIFVRGLDNSAWHKAQFTNSFWPPDGAWEFNGGQIIGKVAVTSRNVNVLDMFVRAYANPGQICTKSWVVNAWSPGVDTWSCFGDTLTKGSPSATSSGVDRLHVFARTDQNRVIEKAWTGSGGWAASIDLGGNTVHDVAVDSRAANVWDAFIRQASNGQVCTKSRSGTTLWPAGTTWHCFPGAFAAIEPTVVSSGTGNLDVFYVGTDAGIWHLTWRAATGWTGPHSLGGATRLLPIAAVSRAANQVDIFIVGTDGQIYTKGNGGSGWWPSQTGWHPLGGDMLDVTATAWGPSRIDLYARDRTLQPRHRYWNGSAWLP